MESSSNGRDNDGGAGGDDGVVVVGGPRVGLIYDERMCSHFTTDRTHPEKPNRIRAIWQELQSSGITNRCIFVSAKKAEDKHISPLHTKEHIDLVKNISSKRRAQRESVANRLNSIYFNEGSSESAYLAAGSVIEVAEKVAKGELNSAFAIVRPPGHHAEKSEPMGFCLFNNVAIATKYLLDERPDLGIKKILIVDWDVHHGNGTQKMFWKDPRVLFFSVHRYDSGAFYPCSDDGSHLMIGEGPGEGYNINVPWENGRTFPCEDADYIAAWDHVLIPVAREFKPDIIMISAGFDAALGDPLGGCRVTPYGYSVLLKKLMEFADGKIVMALEGGYNFNSLAKSVKACVEVLLEDNHRVELLEDNPYDSTWEVIKQVREKLKSFWPVLAGKLPEVDNTTRRRNPPIIESSSSESEHDDTSWCLLTTFEEIVRPLSELTVSDGKVNNWRTELSKVDIWYATYGSNMLMSRFLCYIQGGQVEGMKRACAGSVDKSLPREIMWKTVPHRLFFGRDETKTWGPGGVAFLNPESDLGEKAHILLYRITLEQFNDVLFQENVSDYDMSSPPFDLTHLDLIHDTKSISLHLFQSGWYHNVVFMGYENGLPILTMTDSDVEGFKTGKLPLNAPAKEYENTLLKGLMEDKYLSQEDAIAYLGDASTKPFLSSKSSK
ncbi:histone deacetylase 5 isoform X2 [Impatiens glandulifera]|uniref:histone deacetylase 5 isoform X2 n=1 Tax=Impatiens glandulifera TaxID=253017 RepID=UPI001FB059CE|nr:histone deacetylase 5 isoform X2 [Impatiens glandulifera]